MGIRENALTPIQQDLVSAARKFWQNSIRLMEQGDLQIAVAASLEDCAGDAVVAGYSAARLRFAREWGEMRFEKRQQRDAGMLLHGVLIVQRTADWINPMVVSG